MQYHKIIELSEYDNNGNSFDKTKYEIFSEKIRLYICGYDYCSPKNRKLEVSYSYDKNNYKPLFSYIEDNKDNKSNKSNKSKDLVYRGDKTINYEIYNFIKKIYNIQLEQIDNNDSCIIS
jgi:hypothetical protein